MAGDACWAGGDAVFAGASGDGHFGDAAFCCYVWERAAFDEILLAQPWLVDDAAPSSGAQGVAGLAAISLMMCRAMPVSLAICSSRLPRWRCFWCRNSGVMMVRACWRRSHASVGSSAPGRTEAGPGSCPPPADGRSGMRLVGRVVGGRGCKIGRWADAAVRFRARMDQGGEARVVAGGQVTLRRVGQVGRAGLCWILHGSEPPIPIKARPCVVINGRGLPRLTFVSRTVRTGWIGGPVLGLLPRSKVLQRPTGGLLGRWQSRGQGFESPQLHSSSLDRGSPRWRRSSI
jgi:hypothetical protein